MKVQDSSRPLPRHGSTVGCDVMCGTMLVSELAAIVSRICAYYRKFPMNDTTALAEAMRLVSGRGPEKVHALLRRLPVAWGDHAITSVYATLMPRADRKRLGAYFTPPHLVDHLLRR